MLLKQTIIALALMLGIGAFFVSPVASADCGGVKTSLINCDETGKCPDGNKPVGGKCSDGSDPIQYSGVWGILLLIINILTMGVGVAAIGGVVYGSILYMSSGGSADQVKKAKHIIRDVVIGIAAYAVMFAFLNYIIPGGLFG